MSESTNQDKVVWTSKMPDRRKGDRRLQIQDIQANGRVLNVTEFGSTIERRKNRGRRASDQVTLTITGRAIDMD